MSRFFLVIFCLFFAVSVLAQPIVYVTPTGAGASSGASWSNALPGAQLASRVSIAPVGTQFWVAAGTYKPTTTTDRTASFSIASGVSVYGGFAGTETTLEQRISGANETIFSGDIGEIGIETDNSYHVAQFRNVDRTTQLNGFTIQRGYADLTATTGGWGGGILNIVKGDNSLPSISNCKLIDNYGYYGGGIANISLGSGNAFLYLTNCEFTGNKAQTGGAIINYDGGGNSASSAVNSIEITNSLFLRNTASGNGSFGGAIASISFGKIQLLIKQSEFRDNEAWTGGAIMNRSSESSTDVSIHSSRFVNNSSLDQGGAIHNNIPYGLFTFTLSNCLLSKNRSKNGGALSVFSYQTANSTKITNCTFSDNTGTESGDTYYHNNIGNDQNLTNKSDFRNCIIQAVSNPATGPFFDNSGSTTATYTLFKTDFPGTGNLNTDPLFVDPANNDFRLKPNSPAINAGDPDTTGLPGTDFAGQPRIQGGRVDMGAFEFLSCPGAPCLPFTIERKR